MRSSLIPEGIARMMMWPRSRGVQVAIAFGVALLAAVYVFVQIAMGSFNHFYFPPHRAYPYPYPTESAARMAMGRDCGLTFLVVFGILYAVQRRFIAARHPPHARAVKRHQQSTQSWRRP